MAKSAKPKILLIEDEKMLSDMYSLKFSKEGFDLVQAFDGEEGLARAEADKPDLILLDIIMPKLDGFAALKQLKAKPGLKNIPVILLTNLGQEEDIQKGKSLGADDYFIKANHTPSDIVKKVREYLENA